MDLLYPRRLTERRYRHDHRKSELVASQQSRDSPRNGIPIAMTTPAMVWNCPPYSRAHPIAERSTPGLAVRTCKDASYFPSPAQLLPVAHDQRACRRQIHRSTAWKVTLLLRQRFFPRRIICNVHRAAAIPRKPVHQTRSIDAKPPCPTRGLLIITRNQRPACRSAATGLYGQIKAVVELKSFWRRHGVPSQENTQTPEARH